MSTTADLPASAKELYRKPPTVDADLTSSSASITWYVEDAELLEFLQTTAGKTEVIGGVGGIISRVVPLQHPIYTWMYAKGFRGTGFGWDNVKQVRYHEITVNFGNLPWPVDGTEAFITYNSRPDVRTLTAPRGGVLVGGVEPDNDRSLVINGTSMSLTVHQIPFDFVDEAVWNAANGKVNSTPFRGIAPGYVKYLGPTISNSITFAGTRTYEVTHEFSASPILWNQELDATGALADMTVGGSPGYASIDFYSVLFGS